MSQPNEMQKWQAILLNQRRANIAQWLEQIRQAPDRAALVNAEYENILRAVESALSHPTTVMLGYQLMNMLHPIVLDIADWERWQSYLTQLGNLLEDDNQLSKALLFIQLGDVQSKLSNLDDAEIDYRKGIEALEQIDHFEKAAFSKGRLATVIARKGAYQTAIALCEEAVNVAKTFKNLELQSQLELNKSFIYFHFEDYQNSLASANFAYNSFQKMGLQQEAAKVLSKMVALSNELGEWEHVAQQAELLIDDLKDSGDLTNLSSLQTALGVAAFNLEDFHLAENSWHQALRLELQMNNKMSIADNQNNLGLVYTKLGEFQEAEKVFHQAIETYDEIGSSFLKANALDNLAELYILQNAIDKGQAALELTIAELRQIDNVPRVLQIIEEMEDKLKALKGRQG